MRIALISDIHSNWHALQAVAAALEEEEPEAVLCLGDVIGYGANPTECLDWVRRNCRLTILGNHDHVAATTGDSDYFNHLARAALIWTHERLSRDEKSWIGNLPLIEDFEGIRLSHGHPIQPEAWLYVLTREDAELALRTVTAHLVAVGHSHLQGIYMERQGELEFEPGDSVVLGKTRAVVNPGSVGQPRGGDPRAAFAYVDTQTWTVTQMRVDYDVEGARRAILDAGLPEGLGNRLLEGR